MLPARVGLDSLSTSLCESLVGAAGAIISNLLRLRNFKQAPSPCQEPFIVMHPPCFARDFQHLNNYKSPRAIHHGGGDFAREVLGEQWGGLTLRGRKVGARPNGGAAGCARSDDHFPGG